MLIEVFEYVGLKLTEFIVDVPLIARILALLLLLSLLLMLLILLLVVAAVASASIASSKVKFKRGSDTRRIGTEAASVCSCSFLSTIVVGEPPASS